MPEQPEYNGRTKDAVLETKLDFIAVKVVEIADDFKAIDKRTAKLEAEQTRNEERWESHKELHVRERGLLGALSVIGNAAVAAWSWLRS